MPFSFTLFVSSPHFFFSSDNCLCVSCDAQNGLCFHIDIDFVFNINTELQVKRLEYITVYAILCVCLHLCTHGLTRLTLIKP